MRILISISVIFLNIVLSYAQMDVTVLPLDKYTYIDSSYILVTYDVSFIYDTLSKKIEKDTYVLEIGKKCSKSYSRIVLEHDSLSNALIKSGKDYPMLNRYTIPMVIYKNYPDGINTVVHRIAPFPVLVYEEEPYKWHWDIEKDEKTIMSYSCQKAKATFRGRTYEAWFAIDIPISDGPWKFGGLPGLILSIKDTKNHYVFECIGLQKLNNSNIKYWNWKTTKCKRIDANKIFKKSIEAPIDYMKSLDLKVHVAPGYKKFIFPYNPIELE